MEASDLDRELRRLARREAHCRLVFGTIAHAFLRWRAHHELGFARLGDYTRERLGLSPREVQSLARVAARLKRLPIVTAAFRRGALSWTHVRLLAERATPDDEEGWVALAQGRTQRMLDMLASGPPPSDDDGCIDGEPRVLVQIRCPRRVRARWREIVELARRMAGSPLAGWQAAEGIAAEGLSARGIAPDDPLADLPDRTPALPTRADPPVLDPHDVDDPIPAELERLAEDCRQLHALPLDERLRHVVAIMQRIDAEMGRLLCAFFARGLHRVLGFRSAAHYAELRLGISGRKARALVALERKARTVPALAAAYREGALSWVRALTLLPVAGPETGAAWVARARGVTVKRLVDEVEWALAVRDVVTNGAEVGPPPADAVLVTPEWQIGARPDAEPADVEIRFPAPVSVAILLRQAIRAFSAPREPPWLGFARLLEHVAESWMSQPRHRDPVFARDGWRCMVPACTARRNLHDHHIVFRARGGDNARHNRVTVCAWHHLRGIHQGRVRGSGRAPDGITWELGVRGQRCLLRLRGERYL